MSLLLQQKKEGQKNETKNNDCLGINTVKTTAFKIFSISKKLKRTFIYQTISTPDWVQSKQNHPELHPAAASSSAGVPKPVEGKSLGWKEAWNEFSFMKYYDSERYLGQWIIFVEFLFCFLCFFCFLHVSYFDGVWHENMQAYGCCFFLFFWLKKEKELENKSLNFCSYSDLWLRVWLIK